MPYVHIDGHASQKRPAHVCTRCHMVWRAYGWTWPYYPGDCGHAIPVQSGDDDVRAVEPDDTGRALWSSLCLAPHVVRGPDAQELPGAVAYRRMLLARGRGGIF